MGTPQPAPSAPRFITNHKPPIEKREPQRDILLALDLSQSMDTRDFAKPDGTKVARVDAVRALVSDFVAKRNGDGIGLIAFGDAMDHAPVRMLMDGIVPGMPGPRTAMGDDKALFSLEKRGSLRDI